MDYYECRKCKVRITREQSEKCDGLCMMCKFEDIWIEQDCQKEKRQEKNNHKVIDFGPDPLGKPQVFEVPTKEELLVYLKTHLLNLRRNPNNCPYVTLQFPAMYIYALLDKMGIVYDLPEIPK